MALSAKEAAIRIIEQLPDDATHEDLMRALSVRFRATPGSVESDASAEPSAADAAGSDLGDVTYHLEREGHITVLVPDRPLPPLDPDVVNRLIDGMRREREKCWLYPMKDGD